MFCSFKEYTSYLVIIKLRRNFQYCTITFFFRFIYDWVYSGVFRDVYGEFMIQVNEDYLCFRGTVYIYGTFLIYKIGTVN